MRPAILGRGQRAPARAFIRLIRGATGHPVDPVVQLALYRPAFFGRPFLELVHEVMRGPSFWTPAEREYLAVYSSQLNQCPFCARMHAQVATVESRGEIDVHHAESARPELLAILPMLRQVSQSPELVSPSDVDQVRAAGVPDAAIVDALHVNMIFNCINRLANAFDFGWDDDRQVHLGARVIHRTRYRLPGFLMR